MTPNEEEFLKIYQEQQTPIMMIQDKMTVLKRSNNPANKSNKKSKHLFR
jgi:hypothetical protein